VATKADDVDWISQSPSGQHLRSSLQARSVIPNVSTLITIAALISGAAGCAAPGGLSPLLAVNDASSNTRVVASVQAPLASAPVERPIAVRATEARVVTVETRLAAAAWRSFDEDVDSEILANSSRCPAEMALVDGRVCVDRWEASLVERLPSGELRPWSPYHAVDGNESRVRAVSRPGVIPQGYISGEQALRACQASGKRLCAADEWERACRGPKRTRFPYGDERKSRVCNDDIRRGHPVVEVALRLGIPDERRWTEGMNQPLINQLPDSLFETGERADCTNEYGVFDMVGNLHEWIEDRDGTFRGGFYMDTSLNGDGCSYQTTAHDFRYHDYSTGFRCCMDPDRVE